MSSTAIAEEAVRPRAERAQARRSGRRRRRGSAEYWLYFALIFPVCLLIAGVAQLLPRAWRPLAATGRGVFADAKAATNTVLPFVFMG
ncbi:MAG: cytochrome PufQ [Pseudomonadota bacterium]